MNYNEVLENFNEGSGFGSFLKDQSKKFIKKGIEKALNTRGEKVGELIANKIIPPSKFSSSDKTKKNSNIIVENENTEINQNIPIDSGYKIIKLLKRNHPVDNIRKQFISI